MSRSKLKPEDFVELLTDQRVIEALGRAITPFIAQVVKVTEDSINLKLSAMSDALKDLKTDNSRLNAKCAELTAENASLKSSVAEHARRIIDLETYSRSSNLIIRGLPESSSAERATNAATSNDNTVLRESHLSVETSVLSFCRDTLHVDIKNTDIAIAHRLKAGRSDSARPVIVRFANRRIRNDVYHAKRLLKGNSSRIFISEHLTKEASELFFEARKLQKDKKLFSTWTNNGAIYFRLSSDPTCRPVLANARSDLPR